MMRKWIITWMVCLMTLGTGVPQARAQFIDNGNSPAENVRNRGARAPGQLVRAGIVAHSQGPEITQPEIQEVPLRVNLLLSLFQGLFNLLAGLVPFVPSFLNPVDNPPATGGPGGGLGGGTVIPVANAPAQSLVMTEVAHNGNVVLVELFNRGLSSLNLEGVRFHDGSGVSPSFPPILLNPGDTYVVQLSGESQSSLADMTLSFRLEGTTSGELALYDFSGIDAAPFPQDDATLMLDYVQWSTATLDPDTELESTAARANLWNAIDFIESALSNQSFRLNADAESLANTTRQSFIVGPFSENTLGLPESQAATLAPDDTDNAAP